MSAKCKHGLEPRFCALCRQADETAPLRSDAIWLTSDGRPALVVRVEVDSERAMALLLDGRSARIEVLSLSDLRAIGEGAHSESHEWRDRFHAAALEMGYLFHPNRPLTVREQGEEGPTHCYQCKTEVSWEKGSLGCTKCRYYVCRCGRCLCGYTGRNYRGELFSQYPPLPIPREQRLEFVRVVGFCSGGG